MDTFGREYCLVAQQLKGRSQSTLLSDTFWNQDLLFNILYLLLWILPSHCDSSW